MIHSTCSDLDGMVVVIVGEAAFDAMATHYIVQLKYPGLFSNGFSAIQITEHCLTKI